MRIFITGIPGSGKSTLAKELSNQLKYPLFEEFSPNLDLHPMATTLNQILKQREREQINNWGVFDTWSLTQAQIFLSDKERKGLTQILNLFKVKFTSPKGEYYVILLNPSLGEVYDRIKQRRRKGLFKEISECRNRYNRFQEIVEEFSPLSNVFTYQDQSTEDIIKDLLVQMKGIAI